MKDSKTIEMKVAVLKARIENLLQQKENNASMQNWTVVNGIKQQLIPLNNQLQALEWVLDDEAVG